MDRDKIVIDLIGSDPEFFIVDPQGKIVSSIGLIPGTKNSPEDLTEHLGNGFSIQRDNILAEACVPPVKTPEEMFDNISRFIQFTNDHILKGYYKLVTLASANVDPSLLDNEEAQEFGCSSSYNGWTGMQNESPSAKDNNFRSAGGHIHLSYNDPDYFTNLSLIQALDLYLGVPSVILDKDIARRELYGKAGEYRPTPFGVEYRSLSNYWVNDLEFTKLIFKGIDKAIEFVNNNLQFTDIEALEIQNCINSNDRELAEKLIKEHKLEELVLVTV